IVAGFVVSPQVTWTVLPGSAVPATRTPAAASPASTTSLAATTPIIGASGGVVSAGEPAVSTGTSTLVGALSPAALDAVAVIVVAPSSGTSSMGKLTDHTPFSSVVAVWVKDSPSAPLQTTVMVLPGWAVPVTVTPAAASVESTPSPPATGSMTGASGGVSAGGVLLPPPPPPPAAAAMPIAPTPARTAPVFMPPAAAPAPAAPPSLAPAEPAAAPAPWP